MFTDFDEMLLVMPSPLPDPATSEPSLSAEASASRLREVQLPAVTLVLNVKKKQAGTRPKSYPGPGAPRKRLADASAVETRLT